ncbi:MAG: DinB family protein, partial [Flavobacteriales bacterium]
MNVDNAIKIWFERLDAVTKHVESEFDSLTHEQLNWKLSAEKWSIAEVLEHLNLVNASYEKILSDSASG